MAERLERGSETLSRFKTPKVVITSLATFGLLNAAMFFWDGDKSWTLILGMNISACILTLVMDNQQRLWARRIIRWYLGLLILSFVIAFIWLALHHRLYEVPDSYRLMLQAAVRYAASGSCPVGQWRTISCPFFQGPVVAGLCMLGFLFRHFV